MTSNRMEAKPIAGEPGRFCGDANAPLVKTPCCEQWIPRSRGVGTLRRFFPILATQKLDLCHK
jgi:hypothetical protein